MLRVPLLQFLLCFYRLTCECVGGWVGGCNNEGDVGGGIFLPLGCCMHSAEENDTERLGTQGGVLNF